MLFRRDEFYSSRYYAYACTLESGVHMSYAVNLVQEVQYGQYPIPYCSYR